MYVTQTYRNLTKDAIFETSILRGLERLIVREGTIFGTSMLANL